MKLLEELLELMNSKRVITFADILAGEFTLGALLSLSRSEMVLLTRIR